MDWLRSLWGDYNGKVYEKYHQQIMELEGLNTVRLADNHATLLAMLDGLCTLLKISNEFRNKTRDYIFKIAQKREKDLDQDPDEVMEFWHLYEFLENSTQAEINHSADQALIAINLNEMVEIARHHGSNIGDITLLRKLLPSTKRYEFVDNKNVHSRYAKKAMRCYVFKRESGK